MKSSLLLLFCFVSFQLFSQDYIFTNFNQTPMSLGPQFASSENETVNLHTKVHGILNDYDSWYKYGFLSFNKVIKADSNYRLGISPKIDYDEVGSIQLRNMGIGTSISYTRRLAKKSKSLHEISLGLDVSLRRRAIDETDLRWPTQITSEGFAPNLPGEEIDDRNYFQLNSGINWYSKFSKFNFNAGYTLFSLNKPNISLWKGNGNYSKPMYHQFYFIGSLEVSKEFNINPRFLYGYINDEFDSYNLYGLDAEYKFNENLSVDFGIGKFSYGMYFSGSISIRKMRIGLAYNRGDRTSYTTGELNLAYKL